MTTYSYLALGDSYTIGEQVGISDSFPYQAVQLLRAGGRHFYAPEIIATTGWTTDELAAGIDLALLLPTYDVVSLLIGVNNQYRGKLAASFSTGFIELLQTAIRLAGNDPGHVVVLSIPDWGVTPFAAERDREKIAADIDAFNAICQAAAEQFQTHFIDITTAQRTDGGKPGFLAADQLHPSGNEYAKWAGQLCNYFNQVLAIKG